MIKQTNAQETLKRGKGKYKGDEDNLKSSTQNPEKELKDIIKKLEYLIKQMNNEVKIMVDLNKNEISTSWFCQFHLAIYSYLKKTINKIKENLAH